ncbi:site-2 protease family protein [Phycisphaerales bacterium AB-hyl4]|uniref:Site-2 protease family protein n=1 Tax=Natronomicrosphaera hydrolytica TaxID=3242702 RepID=A0ABV4U4A7_9BACT
MDLLTHTPIALLALILGFGFLIFVHELGHFLVARAVGIKCTQFAIGFGPSMITWRKGIGFRVGTTEPEYQKRINEGVDPASLGETEYRLNYLPLGGYVKMLGQEDMDPNAQSEDPRAFNKKPVWARACVISAGVVMNLIFGLLFLIIAFMSGVQFPPALVGGVQSGAPADVTYAQGYEGDPDYRGLRVGDHITHINGDEIGDFMELRLAAALGRPDVPIEFTIDREGADQPLIYRMAPRRDPIENLLSVGIAPISSLEAAPREGGTLDRAGVREGMRVVAVNGEAVDGYGQLYRAVQQFGTQPFEVTFATDDGSEQVNVSFENTTPQLMVDVDDRHRALGHLAGLVPAVRLTPAANSPAEQAGIEAGDVLVSLGSDRWPSTRQLPQLVEAASREGLDVTVLRDGETIVLESRVRPSGGRIGVALEPAMEHPIVAGTLTGTAAASLDLPAGSRVVELAGEPVSNWAQMQAALIAAARAADGDDVLDVEITYELNIAGSPTETDVLSFDAETIAALARLQWQPPRELQRDLLMLRERLSGDNPIEATVIGLQKTHQFMLQTYVTLLRLIQGWIGFEQLRGPVGIVDEGRQVAAEGWAYLFFFLGLISINLAIINFLPIPIVDGGLMVFLIIEKLKGSPAGPRVQTAATLVGLALIGFVFVTVTFYDIVRIAGG